MPILVVPMMLALSTPAPLRPGELSAEHLALVFNKNSQPSGQLAMFYANVRGVPEGRLIGLDLPRTEELRRTRYESGVVEPIRHWLLERDLARRVACLVIFYDVPIRIGPQPMTAEIRAALVKTQRERSRALREYGELLAAVESIARPTSRPTTTTTTAPHPPKRAADIRKQFRVALTDALRRASRLGDPAAAHKTKQRLLACMERAEGTSGILPHVRQIDRGDPRLGEAVMERLRQKIREGEARINTLLRSGPLSPARDEARRLLRQFGGIIGLLSHLEKDIKRLRGGETKASLDSELSTIWAPPAALHRWRYNTLNARLRANGALRTALGEAEWQAPVMMVSRLDGPDPTTVRRMIEDAVSTEKVGLKGHAYVDARGMKGDARPGSYGHYDQDLRKLAGLMRAKTAMPTVLDDRAELFGPGACPDTALYCGWYSVGRYRDAFDFVRGAVAVHLASSEAVSLRDPKRRYWCKELLADGASATIGPVDEPYLGAFPLPSDFFGLLLTGRYSLVECFYATKPYNSWMLLLIGDPLYRPFAVEPQLDLEDVYPADVLPLQPVPTSQSGS